MQFVKRLVDNAPKALGLTGYALGGLAGGAADLYLSHKYRLVPNTLGATIAGAAVGGLGGAFVGYLIKKRFGTNDARIQNEV